MTPDELRDASPFIRAGVQWFYFVDRVWDPEYAATVEGPAQKGLTSEQMNARVKAARQLADIRKAIYPED